MTDFIQLVANDLQQQPRKMGKGYFFKCPFHGGGNEKTPSLKVSNGDSAHNPGFNCFACNEHGGAVGYFLKRGYNLDDARQKAGSPALPYTGSPAPQYDPPDTAPGEAWQERAQAFVLYAREQLHAGAAVAEWTITDHKTGEKSQRRISALEWLISRGLSQPTARAWAIGYNPKDIHDKWENWGLKSPDDEHPKIWIPQGLVIPHIVNGVIWGIKIRRSQGDPKYIHVTGSIPALYMADNLTSGAPIMLTEGEIDALTLWQEASDLVHPCTLGAATNTKRLNLANWGLYFLASEERYTVFDLDEAGRKGAEALNRYHFRPCQIPQPTPWAKDINDYYNATGRLREWVQSALQAG